MISLVVIIMILQSATTQQWNHTSFVINPSDSNVTFICPFNQPFINFISTYDPFNGRLWQFDCDNSSLNFPLGTWMPLTAPARNFTIECPHNYFISGIQTMRVQTFGNVRIWSFYCSATLTKKTSLCKWTKPTTSTENFTLSLHSNDTVITGVKAVFDISTLDHHWSYHRCTLRDICSGFTFPENLIVTQVFNYVLKFSCQYGFRLEGEEFINCSSLNSTNIPHCEECCGLVPLEKHIKTVCNLAGTSLQATCPHGYYITGETEFCTADVEINKLPFCTSKQCETEFGDIKQLEEELLINLNFLECQDKIKYCVEYYCHSKTDVRCSKCQPTHPITGLPLIPNKRNKKCKSPGTVLSMEISPDKHYFKGHNWIVTCTVGGSGNVSTHWYFNNTEKEKKSPGDGDYIPIDTNDTGPGFVLCKAMNNLGCDIKNISVASVNPIVVPNDTFVISPSGSTVVLDCATSGDVDYVLWSKETNTIPTNGTRYTVLKNSSLRIYSVSLADCGMYKCFVKNLIGNKTLTIVFHVSDVMPGDIGNDTILNYGSGMFEPAGIIQWNESYVVPLGSTIELYCLVIGFPLPLIVWRKNGRIVFATGVNGYNITSESRLVLHNVSMETSGRYECLAANIFGMDSETTFVTVTSLYEITSTSYSSLASTFYTSLSFASHTSDSSTTSISFIYHPQSLIYPTKFHLILFLTICFITLFVTVILALIIYMRNRYCYRYIIDKH